MADRDKALEDYKAGLSYKEIADKHNVSESTVKSWASRHWNNDKKIQAARRKAKKSQLKGKKSCNQKSEKKSQKDAPKPRGAPKGSVNAAGNNGGAPKGSKNALKHGGYSVVKWDELTEEERAMAESMEDTDTEDNLHEEVVLYTIRERRILRAINNMKEVTLKGNVEISTNVSVHKKGSGADTRVVESTTTNLERAEIAVLRLERELTSVQKAKARTLQTLDEVRRANGKDDDTWLEEFVAAIEAEDESEAEDEVSPEE